VRLLLLFLFCFLHSFRFSFFKPIYSSFRLEFSEIVQQILAGTHCCMQILGATDTDTDTLLAIVVGSLLLVAGGNCNECCYFSLTCTFTLRGLCLSFDVHFLFMFMKP